MGKPLSIKKALKARLETPKRKVKIWPIIGMATIAKEALFLSLSADFECPSAILNILSG